MAVGGGGFSDRAVWGEAPSQRAAGQGGQQGVAWRKAIGAGGTHTYLRLEQSRHDALL